MSDPGHPPIRTVLLADSDPDRRAGWAKTLRAQQLEVVEVASGFAAWRGFVERLGDIDFLIAAAEMPEYDGRALAAGLAALRPDLPVILLG